MKFSHLPMVHTSYYYFLILLGIFRINNRQKVKLGSFVKQNLVAEKILWIKQHMVDVCPYTPELTAELLEALVIILINN